MREPSIPAPLLQARGNAAGLMGSSASPNSLRLLRKTLAEQKTHRISGVLDRAVQDIKRHRLDSAATLALEALQIDERCGVGWHILAVAQEGRGDFVTSLSCYEAALALMPEDPEILVNLGRLGFRMGMFETTEKILRIFLSRVPLHAEGVNNLALAIRAQDRAPEAIEYLRNFLAQHPGYANLWNSLGSMVSDNGDPENAEVFYREALRLDPGLARARYNLGNLWINLGDPEAALKEIEDALKRPISADEKAMMNLTRGLAQITMGRLADGWKNYEARNDLNFPDGTYFAMEGPRWKPGLPLEGKSLLLVAEQGLGDEVLFGGILPDVLGRLGPGGSLTLAVEPRLVSLFARSFPSARVEPHRTVNASGRTIRLVPNLEKGGAGLDYWSPLGSCLPEFRPDLESFPDRRGYLVPDPERVAHWRHVLDSAPAGPKVGLLWKSAILTGGRNRYFSPFDAWEPVLRTKGPVFVNLQYGDVEEELRMARERFGVEVWNPPGIDLRQDLDDVAALSSAMDLVIGFSNATFNLAAATGTHAWLISAKGAWTPLGTDRYPWYPQVRLYQPDAYAKWGPVLETIAADLGREFGTDR